MTPLSVGIAAMLLVFALWLLVQAYRGGARARAEDRKEMIGWLARNYFSLVWNPVPREWIVVAHYRTPKGAHQIIELSRAVNWQFAIQAAQARDVRF